MSARAALFRNVALPVEHGGWALLGEPLLLGLLVLPSASGAAVSLAVVAAFLLQHPLKLLAADVRRGASYPRTEAAAWTALAYGCAFAGCTAAAFATAAGPFWAPLLGAAPLAIVQLAHAARGSGRELLPELLGALALSSSAPAVLLAGGASVALAAVLWLLLAGRAGSSVLYIRARLRKDRGRAASSAIPLLVHIALVGASAALAVAGAAPWLAVLAFALLLARAGFGLSRFHVVARPRVVGVQELAFGLITCALLAAGYRC
jgi:hypothetical protein